MVSFLLIINKTTAKILFVLEKQLFFHFFSEKSDFSFSYQTFTAIRNHLIQGYF